MIRAGLLKHRLGFCVLTKTKGQYAETTETPVEKFNLKAEVVSNAKERDQVSDGIDIQNTLTFHLRYHRRITADMVIKFKNDLFEILDIDNPNYANRELFITATKYVQS
ncbi:phage head closure protein [Neptunicella sp.]|uniref:phage head closure protein n=1 Tax=Neptunicella sp. TaxID=2125986 RepID=UPI003F6913EF